MTIDPHCPMLILKRVEELHDDYHRHYPFHDKVSNPYFSLEKVIRDLSFFDPWKTPAYLCQNWYTKDYGYDPHFTRWSLMHGTPNDCCVESALDFMKRFHYSVLDRACPVCNKMIGEYYIENYRTEMK